MPPGNLKRLIVHWTGGAGSPSSVDKEAYHFLVDRVGHIHRGDYATTDNVNTRDGDYAAHTRGLNTGSIGLAICAMAGANEQPFAPGPYPIKVAQWNAAIIACADLCRRYRIEPDRDGLIMHCEVEAVYGVPQNKWDVSVLVGFDRGKWARMTPGEELRARVKILLGEG